MRPRGAHVPVLGFAAFSGTGKTTLLERLIPLLTGRGLRIGMVKHAHHDFDIDQPGKDSYRLRKAGAAQMLIASRARWALLVDHREALQDEPDLTALIGHMDPGSLDLILAEGFKHEAIPKIELHRPALGHPLLAPHDSSFIAVASDRPLDVEPGVPVLDLNDPERIADFVCAFYNEARDN